MKRKPVVVVASSLLLTSHGSIPGAVVQLRGRRARVIAPSSGPAGSFGSMTLSFWRMKHARLKVFTDSP